MLLAVSDWKRALSPFLPFLLTGTARSGKAYRVPDILQVSTVVPGADVIGDVKFGAVVDYSTQLQDFVGYALNRENNVGEFRLILGEGGKITRRLADALANLSDEGILVTVQKAVDGRLEDIDDLRSIMATR